MNTTISRLKREIDLLRVYYTRPLAHVATDKLDVREPAARLPDETATHTEERMIEDNEEVLAGLEPA